MTVHFIQEIVQSGLQLDADRYRALRQKFRNHEVSLELWGEYYDNQATVVGPQELDEYLDTYIASQAANVVAPKGPEPVSMDAVWLPYDEANPAQMSFASDHRNISGTHEILVQWAMLTDEQKQKTKEKQ